MHTNKKNNGGNNDKNSRDKNKMNNINNIDNIIVGAGSNIKREWIIGSYGTNYTKDCARRPCEEACKLENMIFDNKYINSHFNLWGQQLTYTLCKCIDRKDIKCGPTDGKCPQGMCCGDDKTCGAHPYQQCFPFYNKWKDYDGIDSERKFN